MEVTPRHLPLLESQRFDETPKDHLPLHLNHLHRQHHLLGGVREADVAGGGGSGEGGGGPCVFSLNIDSQGEAGGGG